MNECSAYVGVDVHKETIAVAVALPGRAFAIRISCDSVKLGWQRYTALPSGTFTLLPNLDGVRIALAMSPPLRQSARFMMSSPVSWAGSSRMGNPYGNKRQLQSETQASSHLSWPMERPRS